MRVPDRASVTLAALRERGIVGGLDLGRIYPELADWPNSGQAIFAVMLGGINSFLGPVLGAMILLALNDVVTRFTEYQGLVLGIVILAFALGLRRGVRAGHG